MIQAGEKAVLRLRQQTEQEKRPGTKARSYESRVTNVYENGELELSIPTKTGKPVLPPIGVSLYILFYSKGGMYYGTGRVEERYKSNNSYMLRVALNSPLYKYRQPERCSIQCAADMEYFDITLEQALTLSGIPERKMSRRGTITRLDGAEICFITDTARQAGSYIMIKMQNMQMPACILSSEAITGAAAEHEQFINKAEFIIRDSEMLEEIVRFVFDEKHNNKKKEVR